MTWSPVGGGEEGESSLAAWQDVIGDKEMSWVQAGPWRSGEMHDRLGEGPPPTLIWNVGGEAIR